MSTAENIKFLLRIAPAKDAAMIARRLDWDPAEIDVELAALETKGDIKATGTGKSKTFEVKAVDAVPVDTPAEAKQ